MKKIIFASLLVTAAISGVIVFSLTGRAAGTREAPQAESSVIAAIVTETGPTIKTDRARQLKSRGIINYDGKILIDATDFRYLADEIDRLENTYKTETVVALNRIGTYFTDEGMPTIDVEKNAIYGDEAVSLSFNTIRAAIETSQSVAGVSTVPAVDTNGETIYDEISGKPLFYSAATADSISNGGAAWVNGQLLLGNGADNRKHYQEGYQEGYLDGAEEINDLIDNEGLFDPVILTGTADGVMSGQCITASVIIPTNLEFWSAGITATSGCVAYFTSSDYELMYTVGGKTTYDKTTGVVELTLDIGHEVYLGANPKISYKIMYMPTAQMHKHTGECYGVCTVTREIGNPYSYRAGHPEITFYRQLFMETHTACIVKAVDRSTIQTVPIPDPLQPGVTTYTHTSTAPTCGKVVNAQ
ncbi:MAG: hypothetical protein LBV33_04910 [Lachnospiraceae bacterium]|jgi:hypothetical protein|nr:hypothetical protein [Lachnospiraceae bacterium]